MPDKIQDGRDGPSVLADCDKAVVVLAMKRTGSTVLCEQLHRRGIGFGDEHILEYLTPSELGEFSDGIAPEGALERFDLSGYLKRGFLNGTYCTKLMSNYLPAFCAMVAWPAPVESERQSFELLKQVFGSATFLLLHRRDHLAQAVSRLVALDTGVYHRSSGKEAYVNTATHVADDYNSVVIFSYRKIRTELERMENEVRRLQRVKAYLRTEGIAAVECAYEDTHFSVEQGVSGSCIALPPRLYPLNSSLRRTSTPFNNLLASVYCACDELLRESRPGAEDDSTLMSVTLKAIETVASDFPEWAARQSCFISRERYL